MVGGGRKPAPFLHTVEDDCWDRDDCWRDRERQEDGGGEPPGSDGGRWKGLLGGIW